MSHAAAPRIWKSTNFCARPLAPSNPVVSFARASRDAFAERAYGISAPSPTSVCLDAGQLDHLAPLLGFFGDELAEVGGRARNHCTAQIGEPCLKLGIGKASVDLRVELVDDFLWSVLRRAETPPCACLVSLHKLTYGRDVRQCVRARRGGYRERTQLA